MRQIVAMSRFPEKQRIDRIKWSTKLIVRRERRAISAHGKKLSLHRGSGLGLARDCGQCEFTKHARYTR